ncbi:uncharacterized protein LOC142490627 [Ascaphus truei]|uniref:uncharacterized protein LOC142490627 n=1 Tax=Ascaphus truei TaxID=8439 RepID=UPI003F5ADDA4
MLPVTLAGHDLQIEVKAFSDSGSGGNVLDHAFACKNQIPLVKKKSPIGLEAIDGRPLQPAFIIWESIPLILTTTDGHTEAVQRFLGFANYYRKFIRNFSTIALPITALTKKGADPTTWSSEAIEAFEFLKKAFVSAPILWHPDTSLPFTLEVDASDVGAGAVLSQRSTPQEKLYPCGFFSRKFSSAERNYDVGNRELLAIKMALQEWSDVMIRKALHAYQLDGRRSGISALGTSLLVFDLTLCGLKALYLVECSQQAPLHLPADEHMWLDPPAMNGKGDNLCGVINDNCKFTSLQSHDIRGRTAYLCQNSSSYFHHAFCSGRRTSSASRKEMWDTIVIGVNACGNHVRDKRNCHKRFDDIRSKLKKKIQHQRVHATGTGGGPTPQRLILSPLEELLRAKLLPVVVEGLPGDRDIGIYPSQFPPVAPEGHVSPETEQVSSPGSASSTHLEEHDEEDFDDDDDDDDAAAAIDTQIQASDHEEVPIETVLPPNRPAKTTYDAIVASEGKIVEAENRRHSDLMTVLERMIALQEETVSQLAHLHRVFIEVPKQLQKINTSFEALVVQQTQANYWRMTNVPQFNSSQAGSVHAGQFSPHASDIHSPGPNVTSQVADIAVQVPDDILPLPSVQIQQLTPTKEATKRKHKQLLLTSFWSKTTKDTHETDQPSLVQCLPTCSHVSVGTSPVREQSLPKSPVGESLPKSPVGESLPKSPVGESLPKSPVGESLPKSPVGESLPKSPVEAL